MSDDIEFCDAYGKVLSSREVATPMAKSGRQLVISDSDGNILDTRAFPRGMVCDFNMLPNVVNVIDRGDVILVEVSGRSIESIIAMILDSPAHTMFF